MSTFSPESRMNSSISFLHFFGPILGVVFLGIAGGFDALGVWVMNHEGRRWADMKASDVSASRSPSI